MKLTILKSRPATTDSGIFYAPYVPNLTNFRCLTTAEVDGQVWHTVIVYNNNIYKWLQDQDFRSWADSDSGTDSLFTYIDVREDLYTLLTLTWGGA